MEKQEYTLPDSEIIMFTAADVIITSGEANPNEDETEGS